MPKITVTSSQFTDIVACFLNEQMIRPDESVPILIHQDWNDLMTVMNRRGMKTILLQYYMSMDPLSRIRWKMIKDVFNDTHKNPNVYIEITKQHIPEEELSMMGKIKKMGKFLTKVLSLGLLKEK